MDEACFSRAVMVARSMPDVHVPNVVLADTAAQSAGRLIGVAARGRLKVVLGAAPGVGKTFEMLAQGRRRLAQGEDVLAGLIETHGRAETQAQIGELPVLPRKRIPYRNQILEEFDLDAALARHPGLSASSTTERAT